MSGKNGALCPLCVLPASLVVVHGINIIGCPCVTARDRVVMLSAPIVLMTDNHDPGDEDRSER